jgi:hypothetical protein
MNSIEYLCQLIKSDFLHKTRVLTLLSRKIYMKVFIYFIEYIIESLMGRGLSENYDGV